MIDLGKRLRELIDEKEINKIKDYFEFNSTATIYDWINNKYLPNFTNIIKLADYFKLNLDYLLGRTQNMDEVISKEIPPFPEHFRNVLSNHNSSQYKLLRAEIVSRGHLNSWLNKGSLPVVENLVKIADFLNISIDELVGRT